MFGQMGLAQSTHLKYMLYNGWAIVVANIILFALLFRYWCKFHSHAGVTRSAGASVVMTQSFPFLPAIATVKSITSLTCLRDLCRPLPIFNSAITVVG